MKQQVVPRVIARMLIPFMFMFGFYVITHGELGPGGGFQGGVILAAGVILHALIHGIEPSSSSDYRVPRLSFHPKRGTTECVQRFLRLLLGKHL